MGLPIKLVADHLDMSVSIVYAWEQGKRFPSVRHLEALIQYTGLSFGALLSADQPTPARGSNGSRKAALEVSLAGQIVATAPMRNGIEVAGMVGASLFDLVPSDCRGQLQDVLARVRECGRAEPGGIPFTAVEKATWWLRHIAPVQPGGNVHKFLVVCGEEAPDMDAGACRILDGRRLDRLQALLGSLRRNLEFVRGQAQEAKAALWIELLMEMEKACDEAGGLLVPLRPSDGVAAKWAEVPAAPAAEAPAPVRAEAPTGSVPSPARRAILVADDDPFARADLERILIGLGHGVVTAVNGAEAIEKFGRVEGTVDLVLLDTNMPAMGALAVLPQLRAANAGVKIVVLCDHEGDGAMEKLKSAGVDGVLRKPVSKKAVAAMLAQVFDSCAAS